MLKHCVPTNFLESYKVYWKKKFLKVIFEAFMHLIVRLCTNLYVFLCAMLAAHLEPFIFNILLWIKIKVTPSFVVL